MTGKTEKLYQRDAYRTAFTARVTGMEAIKGAPAVALDKTCFYPTSGGQLHDTGTIGAAPVVDVFEKDGRIYHVLEKECSLSGEVDGAVDWERRFDHMQQHTGQHILTSALIDTLGAATVSSSLGAEMSTIDIALTSLSPDDAARAEDEANRRIYDDVPVHILFPEDKELEKMPLRKKPPPGKKTRIIHIEGFDYSPCGGTHCSRTGEVGIIKISRWEKMRGNSRIEFYCGGRALRDYRRKARILNRVSGALSAQESEAGEAVARLIGEAKEQRRSIAALKQQLFTHHARELYDAAARTGGTRIIASIIENSGIAELQMLAQKIRQHGACLVLLGSPGEKPSFVFTRSEGITIDLAGMLDTLRRTFPVKGGGGPGMVQGGLQDGNALNAFIDAAEKYAVEKAGKTFS